MAQAAMVMNVPGRALLDGAFVLRRANHP